MHVNLSRILNAFLILALVLSAGHFWPQQVAAAPGINNQIPFTGTLKNSSGTALSGTYDMVFRIYDAASGGATLWTGTHTAANGNAVSVDEGIFQILLGSGTGNTLDLDFNDDAYYLGISVEGDSEMTPRTRLGAAGYAFNADAIDGLDSTELIRASSTGRIEAASAATMFTVAQNGSGDIVNFYDGGSEVFTIEDGGNVGIGTSSPSATLTIDGDIRATGAFFDSSNASGTSGMILQSTGTGTAWVATTTLNISGGDSAWTESGSDIYYDSGSVSIGTSTAGSPLTVDGNTRMRGNVSVGDNASPQADRLLYINEAYNNTGNLFGTYNSMQITATAPTNRTSYSSYNLIEADAVNENGFDYNMVAVRGEVQVDGSSSLNNARGGEFVVDQNSTTGSISSAYPLSSTIEVAAGTSITNAYSFFSDLDNAGTISSYYGIFLQDVVEGTMTDAYAFWTNQGDMVLDGDGDGIAGGNHPGSDLFFGEGQDTALYYDGDNFYIDTQVTGTGNLIVPSGRLGLGTSTPGSALTVSGNISATGTLAIEGTATSTFLGSILLDERKSLGFTLPGDDGVRMYQDPNAFGYSDLVITRKSSSTELVNLAFPGGASMSANAGESGAGNYMPSLSLNANGSVQVVNSAQGTATDRYFEVNMSNGARITTGDLRVDTGKLAVGTTTASSTVTVDGEISATNLLGGSSNLTTDANGNIIREPSDERLKTKVEPVEDALDTVLALEGVTYEWKNPGRFGEQREVGFIAQDVEKVLPEVVRSGGEYYSINTRNILAVVVEAIKEMYRDLTDYRDRTEELEDEVNTLKAEVRALKDAQDSEIDVNTDTADKEEDDHAAQGDSSEKTMEETDDTNPDEADTDAPAEAEDETAEKNEETDDEAPTDEEPNESEDGDEGAAADQDADTEGDTGS